MTALTIAVSGINATDNPGPGTGVARSLREAEDLDVRIVGLAYDAMEPGIYMDWLVDGLGFAFPGSLSGQEIDIEGAYHRSYEYERTEDYENAIRALAPVYETYPNGYTVNLRMGWLFHQNGNFNNAIEHYEVATLAAPFALEPKLGQLLPIMAQGHWGEAESLAYQIVSVDHYNYYGNLRLAIILRMEGKTDAAYQIVVKMAQAYPTDIYFLTELAVLNDIGGNVEEATRLFADVLILDPENQDARRYLGR